VRHRKLGAPYKYRLQALAPCFPHDAGNDPFDPIAPAGEGNGRARGREYRSLV